MTLPISRNLLLTESVRKPPPSSPLAWLRDPDDKRDKVLGAARTLFARRGFQNTKATEVAQLAGVSVGLVYHYYGNKAGLLDAVAEQYSRAMAEAMFVEDGGGAPDPAQLVHRTFDYVRDGGALITHLDRDSGTRGAPKRVHRDIIGAALEEKLQQWTDRGYLQIRDIEAMAVLLYGLVEAALIRCYVDEHGRDEVRWRTVAIAAVTALFGVRGPPTS